MVLHPNIGKEELVVTVMIVAGISLLIVFNVGSLYTQALFGAGA